MSEKKKNCGCGCIPLTNIVEKPAEDKKKVKKSNKD
jgi:hypothetical protein